MKVLNSIAVSVMLTTLLAACSHSNSGQDTAPDQQVVANQTNAKASEPAQTGASVASAIQPTTPEQTAIQPAGSTSSSQTNSAATPQVAAPAIASTIVPVTPTISAPTGPDRTQAMTTTGCNQRSCQ